MTAPDTRDSVERIVAEMRDEGCIPTISHAHSCTLQKLDEWADRLSALPHPFTPNAKLARAMAGAQQAGGEDGWVAVADRLPTLDEWPIGTIRTALTFHPMRGIRTETMRPEHWNHIDRRGPGYHGPEVTHWRFPPPPPAAIDAAIGGTGDA